MSAPAGWYADSNNPGHDRYWDGTAWTDQIRESAIPAPSSTPPGVQSSPVVVAPTEIKHGMNTSGKIALGIVAALIAVVAVGAIVQASRPKPPAASSSVASSTQATPSPGVSKSPSAVASPSASGASESPVTSQERTCFDVQADYLSATKSGRNARAAALKKEGDKLNCRLMAYGGGTTSGGGGSSLPRINGVAYKWADNPNCDYFACFGMTVKPIDQSCPNGLYVELNYLDGKGNVVGYSNDTVGSLRQGQAAKLIFDVVDDGVKSAEITEISCY